MSPIICNQKLIVNIDKKTKVISQMNSFKRPYKNVYKLISTVAEGNLIGQIVFLVRSVSGIRKFVT